MKSMFDLLIDDYEKIDHNKQTKMYNLIRKSFFCSSSLYLKILSVNVINTNKMTN